MVGQRETGAGGITAGFGVQVDADLVIAQAAQQARKHLLRVGGQALPIGGIVASDLGAQIGGGPAGQPGAQGGLGLILALFAVEMFKPFFQRLGRAGVKLTQQHGLPVVPGVRPHAADVADGQHGQQVQPLAGFNRLGKVAHGSRVADVAFLRHVGHQQMPAHQPLDRLAFLLVQAQPGRHAPRDLGAEDRVILGPALPDVMEEKGDIQNPAADPGLEDRGRKRQILDQLAPLDLGQHADGLDDVFVHRVVVVDVELHHRHDRLEFRDIGGENPQFVHPAQCALGVAVLEEQVEKDPRRLGVVAGGVVHPVEVGGQQAHGVGMDQIAGAHSFLEDAQEIQRVRQETGGVGHVDPALQHLVAGFQPLAGEDAFQPGFRLDVAGLKLGQEDAGQLADAGGMAEIVLHEDFHRPPATGIAVAHALGHFDLKVEGQLVGGAAGDVVHVATRGPQEILGALEGGEFVIVEQPRRHQTGGRLHPMQVFADPVEGLQVAQAALALFDIRFQHITLAALPLVPLGPFGELGLDELRSGVAEEVRPQPLAQFLRKGGVAGDEAMLQQGGADRDVLSPQPQAVFHRAAGMADLQLDVPQDIQHRLDDAFGPAGDFPRRQEQKVHVGKGRHLGPAIAADGQNRDALGLGRVGLGVQQVARHRQRHRNQPVGQRRLRRNQRPCRARAGGKGRGQQVIGAGFRGREVAHRDGPVGAGVAAALDFGGDGRQQGGRVHKVRGRDQKIRPRLLR